MSQPTAAPSPAPPSTALSSAAPGGAVPAKAWRARALSVLLAACVAAGAYMMPHFLPFAGAAEEVIADLRFAALGSRAPSQNTGVALVTVTEDTLANLPYRSPIDRLVLAQAVAVLAKAEIAALGIDILLDRPTEQAKDEALAQALADFPTPVVLAWADAADGLGAEQTAWIEAFAAAAGARTALPALARDADGTIRRWPRLVRAAEGHAKPGFAAALVPARVAEAAKLEAKRIDYLGLPLDGADGFATLPIHALPALAALNPAALSAAFKGRVVILGADLPGIDRHRTPLAARAGAPADTAGMEVHAQMVAQLQDGRRVRESGLAGKFIFVFVFALAGAALAHWERPGWQKALMLVAVALGLWVIGFALVSEAHVLVPLVAPKLALFGAYGIESARAHRRERALRRFIRNAFMMFVPPAVVEELTRNPASLALGGERRVITALFTDVEGFTTLAERLPAHELVPLLNAYLDGASRLVLAHGGTIDKFVGDAVVAFFGAPLAQDDHARRAVDCARALDAFAEAFRAGHPGFGRTRIGVHTGPATVGNFGGEGRFDYTAMGDTMNTAARLESANKHLGTRVCVSAVTASGCDGAMLIPVGDIVLKGKTEAVGVFTPLAGQDESGNALSGNALSGNGATWNDRYRAAYAALVNGEESVAQKFQALADERPGEPLARLHLARIRAGARDARIVLEEK